MIEHDEEVLEFCEQILLMKLDYQGKDGQNLGVLHTPDFFALGCNFAGWEKCKTEEELKKPALKAA